MEHTMIYVRHLLLLSCFPYLMQAAPFDGLELYPQQYEFDVIPYIQCNEAGQAEAIEELSTFPCEPNALHIGWSIEFNFRIIAARRPHLAIICDINKRVFEFFEIFEQAMLSSRSTAEFFEQLKGMLEPQTTQFFKTEFRTQDNALKSYMEWMTEEDFQNIKRMYADKRIIHFVLNVTDQENKFSKIATWIRDRGYHVDTVYASNIVNWVRNKAIFSANLRQLIGPHTLFIDANYVKKNKLPLTLRITQGLGIKGVKQSFLSQ